MTEKGDRPLSAALEPAVERAVEAAVADDADYETAGELVERALRSELGGESATLSEKLVPPLATLVEVYVAVEETEYATTGEFVAEAVRRELGDD